LSRLRLVCSFDDDDDERMIHFAIRIKMLWHFISLILLVEKLPLFQLETHAKRETQQEATTSPFLLPSFRCLGFRATFAAFLEKPINNT
jgi:hypothetical protein